MGVDELLRVSQEKIFTELKLEIFRIFIERTYQKISFYATTIYYVEYFYLNSTLNIWICIGIPTKSLL